MITFAGPSNSASPISVSSDLGVRRGRRLPGPPTAGSLTPRSTCPIGSLTVIALPSANSENSRFLILQPGRDRCQDGPMALAETTGTRPYRGVEAAERLATRRARLLGAGLDLLGAERHDAAELTVRSICRRAG